MTWFTAGTIAIVSGSDAVAGTGTAWSAQQILPGFALVTSAGVILGEIETVNSPTSITLVNPVAAASASGIGYMIVPTRGSDIQIYNALSQLIADYASVRDNAGQGMFADGAVDAPGIRFLNDQNTGFYRLSNDVFGAVTNGILRLKWLSTGASMPFGQRLGLGTDAPGTTLHVLGAAGDQIRLSNDDPAFFYRAGRTAADGYLDFHGNQTGFVGYRFGGIDGELVRFANTGNVGIGAQSPSTKLAVGINTGTSGLENSFSITNFIDSNVFIRISGTGAGDKRVQIGPSTATALCFATADTERVRIDGAGNLMVGAAGGTSHVIFKTLLAQTDKVLDIGYDNSAPSMRVYGAYAGLGNSAHCAANFAHSSVTSRSINAGGTINASGADYAEYMVKAAACGTIAKGDICGVDIDGNLTQSWEAARSFVIKSSDPSLVGGDTWAHGLDPRPEAPAPIGAAPEAPIAPAPFTEPEPMQDEGESDAAFAVRLYIWGQAADAAEAAQVAYDDAVSAFPDQLAAWESASAAHAADLTQYEADLAAWEAALEAERVKVDRIAFCGQVPANLTGSFDVGDYVVPAEGDGDTITAVAVAESAITFEQYRDRIGKVWAIREGRAWIDVQHG